MALQSGGSFAVSSFDARYTEHKGFLLPGDELHEDVMTVSSAKQKALDLPGCVGFSCENQDDSDAAVQVYFKGRWNLQAAEDDDDNEQWRSFKLEGLELQKGSRVRVRFGFLTDDSNSVLIEKDACGTVQKIDDDEDVLIAFDGMGEERWVFRWTALCHLEVEMSLAVSWAFADCNPLAYYNPVRWSKKASWDETVEDIWRKNPSFKRPIWIMEDHSGNQMQPYKISSGEELPQQHDATENCRAKDANRQDSGTMSMRSISVCFV
jgi:hypothetical protein